MILGLSDFKTVFFIGIAGTGMSAIAQYLAETESRSLVLTGIFYRVN